MNTIALLLPSNLSLPLLDQGDQADLILNFPPPLLLLLPHGTPVSLFWLLLCFHRYHVLSDRFK